MEEKKKQEKISASILRKVFITAVTLLITALAMFASAHFFGNNLSRAGHSSSTAQLEIVVGNEYLKIPANKIRFYNQRHSGAHQKLDLYIHWPSLSGYQDDLSNDFNNATENKNLVFIEDLYYAASSPYPFATRCVRAVASTTPFCIRDIHVGKNLMLTYRFHQKHLGDWIELEQSIRAIVRPHLHQDR